MTTTQTAYSSRIFHPDDLERIEADIDMTLFGSIDFGDDIEGVTVIGPDGIESVGGIKHVWNGRADSWAVLRSPRPSPGGLLATVRAGRAFLDEVGRTYHRIEAATLSGWEPGEKWLAALGYRKEGVMRKFGPDGSDYSLWARIREEAA